jgi:CRP-like cAMP-binding protein
MRKIICKQCDFKSPAARTLSEMELDGLESGCAKTNFKSGEIIVKQNALSTNVAYLKSGLAKVHFSGPLKDQIMQIVKAPTYIGLPSNFGNKVNQFSVTALENCSVCFLDLAAFKKFIYANGDFAYNIILEMSKNELKNFHICHNHSQKQTTGRIADAILFFYREIYDRPTFTLPFSRQDFGNLAGTTRENACRILSQFHNEGIIGIAGKRISILNEKLLQQISEKG